MPKPADPDKIPITSLAQLRIEFDSLHLALAQEETEHTWEKIDKAVKRFQAVVRGGAGKKDLADEYVKGMRDKTLVNGLIRSLATERTRLSGTTLDLMASSTRLGPSFAPLLPLYLPTLLRLLCRTNKLYITRSTTTIISIVKNTKLIDVLRYVVSEWQAESGKSASFREKSAEILSYILTPGPNGELPIEKEILDRRVEELEWIIKTAATDRDAKVRAEAKKCWVVYQREWPERVPSFTSPMTPTIRRYLNVNAAGPSVPSAAAVARPPPAAAKKPRVPSALSSSVGPPASHAPAPHPVSTRPPVISTSLNRSTGPTSRPLISATSHRAPAPTFPTSTASSALTRSTTDRHVGMGHPLRNGHTAESSQPPSAASSRPASRTDDHRREATSSTVSQHRLPSGSSTASSGSATHSSFKSLPAIRSGSSAPPFKPSIRTANTGATSSTSAPAPEPRKARRVAPPPVPVVAPSPAPPPPLTSSASTTSILSRSTSSSTLRTRPPVPASTSTSAPFRPHKPTTSTLASSKSASSRPPVLSNSTRSTTNTSRPAATSTTASSAARTAGKPVPTTSAATLAAKSRREKERDDKEKTVEAEKEKVREKERDMEKERAKELERQKERERERVAAAAEVAALEAAAEARRTKEQAEHEEEERQMKERADKAREVPLPFADEGEDEDELEDGTPDEALEEEEEILEPEEEGDDPAFVEGEAIHEDIEEDETTSQQSEARDEPVETHYTVESQESVGEEVGMDSEYMIESQGQEHDEPVGVVNHLRESEEAVPPNSNESEDETEPAKEADEDVVMDQRAETSEDSQDGADHERGRGQKGEEGEEEEERDDEIRIVGDLPPSPFLERNDAVPSNNRTGTIDVATGSGSQQTASTTSTPTIIRPSPPATTVPDLSIGLDSLALANESSDNSLLADTTIPSAPFVVESTPLPPRIESITPTPSSPSDDTFPTQTFSDRVAFLPPVSPEMCQTASIILETPPRFDDPPAALRLPGRPVVALRFPGHPSAIVETEDEPQLDHVSSEPEETVQGEMEDEGESEDETLDTMSPSPRSPLLNRHIPPPTPSRVPVRQRQPVFFPDSGSHTDVDTSFEEEEEEEADLSESFEVPLNDEKDGDAAYDDSDVGEGEEVRQEEDQGTPRAHSHPEIEEPRRSARSTVRREYEAVEEEEEESRFEIEQPELRFYDETESEVDITLPDVSEEIDEPGVSASIDEMIDEDEDGEEVEAEDSEEEAEEEEEEEVDPPTTILKRSLRSRVVTVEVPSTKTPARSRSRDVLSEMQS